MTLSNPKTYYSRFLEGHQGKLHFAAHSHHFWPDVSREAQLEYWDDCAKLSDEKWEKIFTDVIPKAQAHLAQMLHLKHPEQIAFAPNTHELSARLLSLFLGKKSLNILTTSSEFHSWRRQFLRLSELNSVSITQVSTDDILAKKATFLSELKAHLSQGFDLLFLSQVFFDSGIALTDSEMLEILEATPKETLIVFDGYHAYGAIPTNLSKLEGRVFYLGGGYKYAQAGEGVGFMVIPKGHWRPAYTGWFAEFGELSKSSQGQVGYSQDALAFMGATQDPSGLYRFNRVWDHLLSQHWDIPTIHNYVKNLQLHFLKTLPSEFLGRFQLKPLFDSSLDWHGHFLSFEASTIDLAEDCLQSLKQAHITIDRRGPRLRFGFGLYQDLKDVEELCLSLKNLARQNK